MHALRNTYIGLNPSLGAVQLPRSSYEGLAHISSPLDVRGPPLRIVLYVDGGGVDTSESNSGASAWEVAALFVYGGNLWVYTGYVAGLVETSPDSGQFIGMQSFSCGAAERSAQVWAAAWALGLRGELDSVALEVWLTQQLRPTWPSSRRSPRHTPSVEHMHQRYGGWQATHGPSLSATSRRILGRP